MTDLPIRFWRRIAGFFGYLPTLHPRKDWDRQYSTGRWTYLDNLDELAHYSVIAGYVRRLARGQRVLDVCCGTGMLCTLLGNDAASGYFGIDFSEKAIAAAQQRGVPQAAFECTDVNGQTPTGPFGVIVFSECLYYFDDPLAVFDRYAGLLGESGHCIVSMYVETQTRRIWRMLESRYAIVDAVRISNRAHAWDVKVLHPVAGNRN